MAWLTSEAWWFGFRPEAALACGQLTRVLHRGQPTYRKSLCLGAKASEQKPVMQEGKFMAKLAERITVDPEQCGGRPCIRGMRIRVTDVLDLLANGMTATQVLEELPDLEPEDIQACLRFASQRLNHPVVVA